MRLALFSESTAETLYLHIFVLIIYIFITKIHVVVNDDDDISHIKD